MHERTALLSALQEEGCRFNGLINVAGRDYEGGFLDRSRQQVLHLVDLIIAANLDLTHSLLALRDPQQRFLLVNVGSLAAFFPMPFKATYSSAKRFLVNFTLALREEMRDFGNALILCPAGLPTHAESLGKAKAQGFWGQATMMDTALVAHRTIDLALKGRALYVPGIPSRLLAGLGSLFYSPGVARFLGKRWRARQREINANILIK
jgi:short-subunit dehydrogenase